MIWLQGIPAGDTPREQHLYPNSSHESFPTHQHIILLLAQRWRSVHQQASNLKLLKPRKMWVISLERTFSNSELLLPSQKFHQRNCFFFLKIGIYLRILACFFKVETSVSILICNFFSKGISWSLTNYALWSTTFLGTQYLPPFSHYLPSAWKSLLSEEANLLWCFVLFVDLILGLILNLIYFLENDQEHVKMFFFGRGMKLFFYPLLKRQWNRRLFSQIFITVIHLLKGSNFLYYTAN